MRHFASTGCEGGGSTPGWRVEHAALHLCRDKENVSRRRRSRGLVERRGAWGGSRRNGGGRDGCPGPHPKPKKGWGPSGACMRCFTLGLVGWPWRGWGETEGLIHPHPGPTRRGVRSIGLRAEGGEMRLGGEEGGRDREVGRWEGGEGAGLQG